MSNLTVSSAVDEFMQASDQAGMQAALGTISVGLPIVSNAAQQIIQNANGGNTLFDDGKDSLVLQGYDSESAGDSIDFNSGVASVTAAADGLQLPIARVLGSAVYSLDGFTVLPGQNTGVNILVTGNLEASDGIMLNWDQPLPNSGNSYGGCVVLSNSYISGPYVCLNLNNTDSSNTYTLAGNIYVKVIR